MTERDLYTDLGRALNCPEAIAALGIGTMDGRFVKPKDGLGRDKDGNVIRISNPIDLLWVTDCLEVKVVKARTMKGMVFKPGKAFGENQWEELEKHNALLSVGFILESKEKADRKVAIYTMRFWKVQREGELVTMERMEELSDYTIKGSAYGKVPAKYTRKKFVVRENLVMDYLKTEGKGN